MSEQRFKRRLRARLRRLRRHVGPALRSTSARLGSRLAGAAAAAFAAALPERQVFVRSRGRVKAIRLTWQRQAALAIWLLALGLGAAGGVETLLDQHRHLALQAEALAQVAVERDEAQALLGRSSQRYDRAIALLERKHGMLATLSWDFAKAEGQLGELRYALNAVEQEREEAGARRVRAEQHYRRLREVLTQATYLKGEPEGSLTILVPRTLLAFGGALTADDVNVARVTPPALDVKVEYASRLLAETRRELGVTEERRRDLQQDIARLESRLVLVRDMQNELVDRLSNGTDRYIDQLHQALSLTGLDVDNLLHRVDERILEGDDAADTDAGGTGGPFVSAAAPPAAEAAPTPATHPEIQGYAGASHDDELERIGLRVARLSALNTLAESLPLASPVDDFRLSSTFGRRRDPITRRWAQHGGIDMGANSRAPILATAQGVVTFAGWNGPYGRMVEIDHGYGLKSRYGHLYRIKVKRGQRVGKRQQIGIMGSSGRSTGRHLHYEVHFDDRPLDPMTFLKAGDHVFKDGQN